MVGALFSGPSLARENSNLVARISELTRENHDLQNEAAENRQLRALLGFQARSPMALLPVEVIAYKPSPLRDTITISKGTRDGVTQKSVVVDPSGSLVGQVIDSTTDTADVLLLTDDLASVGALTVPIGRLKPTPATIGICSGEQSTSLLLKDMPSVAVVQVGDKVVTSGLGGIYPKGILVGRIQQVMFDHSTFQKLASVAPAADFDHFEEGFVIK
jgi:rod shape-determining protein MreC